MRDDVILLAGVEDPSAEPWAPFAPLTLDFLEALSAAVRREHGGREELAAFGFWCRRSHLEALAKRHESPFPRLGRGLLFHVAPSNVPTMFAYTFAIGLLAGNANIVRLSTRRGETEARLCAVLEQVLDLPRFAPVKARSSFLSYDRDDAITAGYLAQCNGRVVWGGDATVAAIGRFPMPPHGTTISFPDRWSLALLSQGALSGLAPSALAALAHWFYNDTYLMDQNACSSPQMVVWQADGGEAAVRRRWWEAVATEAAGRYAMGPLQATRKYERFCRAAAVGPDMALERYGGNLVYVARLAALPAAPAEWKGGFGLFFEAEIQSLEQLLPLLSAKTQTLACGGVDAGETAAFLAARHAQGVDRVVPVGQALEMDTVWDGRDLIAELSRIVSHP